MADAPSRFYLQWNLVNWITVVLMAALGLILVQAIISGTRAYTGNLPGTMASNDA